MLVSEYRKAELYVFLALNAFVYPIHYCAVRRSTAVTSSTWITASFRLRSS